MGGGGDGTARKVDMVGGAKDKYTLTTGNKKHHYFSHKLQRTNNSHGYKNPLSIASTHVAMVLIYAVPHQHYTHILLGSTCL